MTNDKATKMAENNELSLTEEEVTPSSTAHPAIADGSVSAKSPLRNFMQRAKDKFDSVPQGWGQMRTTKSGSTLSSSEKEDNDS
jgi:hypothetical protein